MFLDGQCCNNLRSFSQSSFRSLQLNPRSKKVGCQCEIRLSIRQGTLQVSRFFLEHNHELGLLDDEQQCECPEEATPESHAVFRVYIGLKKFSSFADLEAAIEKYSQVCRMFTGGS